MPPLCAGPATPLAAVGSVVPGGGSPELQPGLARIELFLAVGERGEGTGKRSPAVTSRRQPGPGQAQLRGGGCRNGREHRIGGASPRLGAAPALGLGWWRWGAWWVCVLGCGAAGRGHGACIKRWPHSLTTAGLKPSCQSCSPHMGVPPAAGAQGSLHLLLPPHVQCSGSGRTPFRAEWHLVHAHLLIAAPCEGLVAPADGPPSPVRVPPASPAKERLCREGCAPNHPACCGTERG